MKFSTALGGVFAAAVALTDAVSIPELKAKQDIQAKRQNGNTVITGVPNNGVQQRVELRTMQTQNPDQFNLYLLGLREFMGVSESDPLSYYQIAGIHGRPYSAWQGWNSNAGSGGYGGGYCTHVSNIFLTWHRPYLALYEQQLYSHVQNVANQFPASERARWQKAAANFRIPYWDWAAVPTCNSCNVYPKLVSNLYTTVQSPTGQQTIINPLFRYDFQKAETNDFIYNPFAQWTVTKRYPTSWDQNGVSQNNLVSTQINNNRASLADRLYNLFTNPAYTNFTMFSNEAWQASSGMNGADSLESVHDAIHSITGNNGHMTYLDYSAYDPIFWLHHANIDRLWAMYSTINPNSYVQRSNAQGSTYTYPSGTSIDANFGLVPFSKDSNRNLFSSNDVKTTTRFGYTYPETANNDANAVKTAVNNLYHSSQNRKRLSKRDNGKEYHYIANIVSQKFQMNGSYAVYMFLGNPGDNAAQWPTSPSLVGTHGVAANLADEQNTGMSQMDLPITGTIPLTTTLLNKVNAGQIANMHPDTVEAYLQKNLQWRVAMYDGTVVPAAKVPGFSITVITSEVQPATAPDQFPTWGAAASMANATFGKDGGHSDEWWGVENSWSLGDLINAGISINGNKH